MVFIPPPPHHRPPREYSRPAYDNDYDSHKYSHPHERYRGEYARSPHDGHPPLYDGYPHADENPSPYDDSSYFGWRSQGGHVRLCLIVVIAWGCLQLPQGEEEP